MPDPDVERLAALLAEVAETSYGLDEKFSYELAAWQLVARGVRCGVPEPSEAAIVAMMNVYRGEWVVLSEHVARQRCAKLARAAYAAQFGGSDG